MEPISFAQFLAEREKLVQMYGTGQSPGKIMAKGISKPANPARMRSPFQGVHFPHIYGKEPPRAPSGVVGGK